MEMYSSLDEVAVGDEDLLIPGLPVKLFGSYIVRLSQSEQATKKPVGNGREDSNLLTLVEAVARRYLSDATATGWICTACMSAAQELAMREAGWELPPADRSIIGDIVWMRLPQSDSDMWNRIWAVPLDPIFTNVIVLDSSRAGLQPPDTATASIKGPVSTLLKWPWLATPAIQSKWISDHAKCLRLLALGVSDCTVGVQFVFPVSGLSEFRSAIDQIHPYS